MLNGEFPRNYINDIWENGFGGHGKPCHFWPVTLNRTLQALKKYEKGIRLLGWWGKKRLEVGDLDVINRSCGVFIYLSSAIPVFFVVFLLGFCIMFFLFGEGKRNKKPWRIMSWWKLIQWFEWMRWEPLKRRKEKVVLVVLQLKTTSYSASLYSKIGHHMFSRYTMKIKKYVFTRRWFEKGFFFQIYLVSNFKYQQFCITMNFGLLVFSYRSCLFDRNSSYHATWHDPFPGLLTYELDDDGLKAAIWDVESRMKSRDVLVIICRHMSNENNSVV